MEQETKRALGLKRMRIMPAKTPKYSCENCGKLRYSPCTCEKRGKK